MKKNDILEKLRAFPLDPDGYWVVAGAAMVLYGIREETHDIDLGCTAELADILEKDGYLYRVTPDGNRWFKIGKDIEVFENWLCGTVEQADGIPAVSLQGLIEMKQQIGREKDLNDIRLIHKFLEKQI